MALLLSAIVLLAGAFPLQSTPLPLAARRVPITLYYESLCGGCRDLIRDQLYPTFTKVGEIMDITLVPYGNAQEHQQGNEWVFFCQHGQAECTGNIIEACAINILQNITVYFPFIHCFEQYIGSSDPSSAAKYCTAQLHIDYSAIEKCQSSSQGNELEHEMALKTNALEPTHQYVPWITLNGKHTDEIQDKATFDMLGLVCDAYQGTKPAACAADRRCYRFD